LQKTYALSHQGLAKRLAREQDPIEIFKIQGQLEQIRVQQILESEVENLDKALEKAEQWAAMKAVRDKELSRADV
jgi:hypothetical protein